MTQFRSETLFRALAAFALAVVSLQAAGQSALDGKDFDQLSKESRQTIFLTEYKEYFSGCALGLNHIKVGLKKAPGGVFLYAEHSFLTYRSFENSELYPCVQNWVRLYSSKLSAAGIVRVGISSYSGDSYFHKVITFR